MSTLRHHATASNPTRRSATSRYAALESVEENLAFVTTDSRAAYRIAQQRSAFAAAYDAQQRSLSHQQR